MQEQSNEQPPSGAKVVDGSDHFELVFGEPEPKAAINIRYAAWVEKVRAEHAFRAAEAEAIQNAIDAAVEESAQTRQWGSSASQRIERPFGFLALPFLRLFCTRTTMEHVFQPIVDDARLEYIEALHAGEPRRAMWLRVRYFVWLAAAAMKQAYPSWLRDAVRRLMG